MVKIENIKAKVLETGRISPLINYTQSRTSASVEVISPKGDEIYKKLISGNTFNIVSNEKKLVENDLAINSGADQITKILDKINDRYNEISLEQGVDSLYITVGLIDWKDRDNNSLLSPLLLIPVKFIKKTKVKKDGYNGYQLALRDEEISFNVSLIQKLKEEKVTIDVKPFTPETDINEYFNDLTNQIEKTNFKILPTCILGIFYNARINIYRDLCDNEDKLINHPIIMAINGDQSKIPPLDHSNEDKYDGDLSYKKNFIVISCDASQLKAINETAENKSLVIEGPPGTGKSQTITNIIATALSNGKKVLFVAEKKAALNVVYKNLKRVNLDDFCLFFDSNKADRKAVFKNLYDTALKNPTMLNEDIFPILDSLDELKSLFDKYNDQVHEVISGIGMSIYEIIGQYIKYSDFEYAPSYIENPMMMSKEKLDDRLRFLTRFNSYLDELGIDDYRKHLFYGYKKVSLSLKEKEEILKLLNNIEALGENELFKSMDDLSIINAKRVLDLTINKPKYINSKWFVKTNLISYLEMLMKYNEDKTLYDKQIEEINNTFFSEVLNLKIVNSLHNVPNDISANSLKKYAKDIKANTKLLKGYLSNRKEKLSKENVVALTNMIKTASSLGISLEANKKNLKEIANTDNFDVLELVKEVEIVNNLVSDIETLPEKYQEIILSGENAQNKEYIDALAYANKLVNELNSFNNYYNLDIINYLNLPINELSERVNGIKTQISSLGIYTALTSEMEKYRDTNIIKFIDNILDNGLNRNLMGNIYCKDFYTSLLDLLMEKYEIVSEFSAIKQSNNIQKFVSEDDVYNLISIAKIREIASNKRPNPNNASTTSDIGILKTQKEKPTMYIKTLFKTIERSLLRLKPVMLMSPLAVSTYLPSDIEFDMVIFDEASQILPEDALCAIYRAKQVVVVGDSEQLPPTDFFKKMAVIESDEDEMEGEETDLFGNSLLDLCKTFLESVRLKWHYRSNNEELITFSNHYIYNDDLVTFPASHTDYNDEGIEFIPTYDGIYGRGTTRTNKVEADKVADLVIETVEKYPNRSIGVVSFSVCQKNEIMSSLNAKLLEIKKFDKERYVRISGELFDESKDEPFFIKNLENVQGDERDVIIFSICYGKDKEDGDLFYNLGKLTREEGRKRINVAASRSKINMKIVCSFDPDLIKISNEHQTGLLAMKNFLVYAKNKTIVKSPKDNLNAIKNDYIVDDIAERLTNIGYKVVKDIGESKFKVDLGILMPDKESDYILGIIVDGDSYNNCQSVRDREKLRTMVLNRLGWNIYSVWSCDYFKNRDSVIKQITVAIQKCLDDNNNIFRKQSAKPNLTIGNFETEIVDRGIRVEKFVEKTYEEIIENMDIKDYNEQFKYIVYDVISREGPIHIVNLASKICKFFGVQSVNENIVNLVKNKIEELNLLNVFEFDDEFYYLKGKHSFYFRRGKNIRYISAIYPLELEDIIYKIIDNSSGIDKTLLFKEVCRYCNYPESKQLSENDSKILNEIYNKLLQNNQIIVIGNLAYTK